MIYNPLHILYPIHVNAKAQCTLEQNCLIIFVLYPIKVSMEKYILLPLHLEVCELFKIKYIFSGEMILCSSWVRRKMKQ